MDRLHFAAWSLDLNDEEYAQALAGLGVLAASHYSRKNLVLTMLDEMPKIKEQYLPSYLAHLFQALRQTNGMLVWRFPLTKQRTSGADNDRPAASILAAGWQQFLSVTSGKVRLALSRKGTALGPLMTCATVLQQPAVRASSVVVADMFTADGRTDWRWPFTIATLTDDPLAKAFSIEQERLPIFWPYCFAVANREHPCGEILVCSTSLLDTLAKVISDRVNRRMALVVLLGGGESWTKAEPLLQALAGELSSEGIVFIDPSPRPTNANLMRSLRDFADRLTHNVEIDIALQQTFGSAVTILMNHDLLRLSHLSHTVSALLPRLKNLHKESMLTLSERSLGQLYLLNESTIQGTTRAIRPDILGAYLDEHKESFLYQSEQGEAAALSEVACSIRENEALQRRRTESPRYIQHRLFRKSGNDFLEENRRLEVGIPVMLKVRVGLPDREWQTSPEVFPDHLLPKRRKFNRLQIVFHEPDQLDQPQIGEILLPPKGASNETVFTFTPRKAAPFQGRITVLHRGRVLQTALVRAVVCEAEMSENGA
jgi:hypothetical protein